MQRVLTDHPSPERVADWTRISTSAGHLLRLARQKWAAEWVRTSRAGITTPQFTVLALLATSDELDQQTIGLGAGLDKSTLGTMLDRLVTQGLVTARTDPANRRRKLVRVTATGLRRLNESSEDQEAVHARMTAELSGDEEKELGRLLRKVIESGTARSDTESAATFAMGPKEGVDE